MNVDIDPKSMYTYKAYSHHLQNTIAHMADLPELTQSFVKKQKPNPKVEEFLEGYWKQLKDMFLLPLTEEEISKLKEKKKGDGNETEEIIKWKRDLKKLYINISKKSGYGFWINYAPGCKERQSKLCEETPKDPKSKKLDYYDLLNMLLIKEGIKPIKWEEDRRPTVDDLSPWPSRANI